MCNREAQDRSPALGATQDSRCMNARRAARFPARAASSGYWNTQAWWSTASAVNGRKERGWRKVTAGTGCIRYGGELIQISTALSGWSAGLSPLPNGLIEVWFAELLVGHLDPKTSSFVAIRPDRGEAGQSKPKV